MRPTRPKSRTRLCTRRQPPGRPPLSSPALYSHPHRPKKILATRKARLSKKVGAKKSW